MSMTHIYIEHNPFTVDTIFKVNDEAIAENSPFAQYKSVRLQEWIDRLGEIIYEALNETQISITFKGTEADCQDMEIAVDEANQQGMQLSIDTILCKDGEQRLEDIKQLMQQAQQDPLFAPYFKQNQDVINDFNEAFNSDFDVYVVATMSSGKSTLINAMLGCDVLPALNEATTASIASITDNKQFNRGQFSAECHTKDGRVLAQQNFDFSKKESATQSLATMSEWNADTNTQRIKLEGDIAGVTERETVRLVLTDTPGPNNSQNSDHGKTTMHKIRDDKRNPLILYVLNGTQPGTNDDKNLLEDIAKVMSEGGKQSRDRFIFVINKADCFDPEKGETLDKVVQNAKNYLINNGIENPRVYPVSALLTGLLRKEALNPDLLTRSERGDLSKAKDLFIEELSMDLVQYMPLTNNAKKKLNNKNYPLALYRSGLPAVEAVIDEYIEKYNVPHRVKRAYTALSSVIAKSSGVAELTASLELKESERDQLQEAIKQLEEQQQQGFSTKGYINKLKAEERGLSDNVVETLRHKEREIREIIFDLGNDFSGTTDNERTAKCKIERLSREIKYQVDSLKVDLERLDKAEQENIKQELAVEYQRYLSSVFAEVDKLHLPVVANLKKQVGTFNASLDLESDEIKEVEYQVDEHYQERGVIGTRTVKNESRWWNGFGLFAGSHEEDVYGMMDKVRKVTKTKTEIDLDELWQNRVPEIQRGFDEIINDTKQYFTEKSNAMLEEYIQFIEQQFDKQFKALLQDLDAKLQDSKLREKEIEQAKQQLADIRNFENKVANVLQLDS